MDPLTSAPDLAPLAAARRMLHEAGLDALALRRRVDVLADATDWRARAADGYRAGVARLVDDLRRLIDRIDLCDGDLASAQQDRVRRALAGW